jgi:hypothetical protein
MVFYWVQNNPVYLHEVVGVFHKNCASGLNATEATSYQYLGMTKIAGALNMLPKVFLREGTNISII